MPFSSGLPDNTQAHEPLQRATVDHAAACADGRATGGRCGFRLDQAWPTKQLTLPEQSAKAEYAGELGFVVDFADDQRQTEPGKITADILCRDGAAGRRQTFQEHIGIELHEPEAAGPQLLEIHVEVGDGLQREAEAEVTHVLQRRPLTSGKCADLCLREGQDELAGEGIALVVRVGEIVEELIVGQSTAGELGEHGLALTAVRETTGDIGYAGDAGAVEHRQQTRFAQLFDQNSQFSTARQMPT